MAKQIRFRDLEDEPSSILGGILLDSGDLICGCCGGLYERDEEGITWEKVKVFDEWTNISEILKEE